MTNDELKQQLTGLFPSVTFEEGGEWLTAQVEPAAWKPLAQSLRSTPLLEFDFLFCITCVDWKTHLTMVYHLTSITHGHTLVVKSKLDRNEPVIETVSDIWRTAEFHERESYDLFGVRFLNHPDLRRLFMTEEWNGWPLRKDYEDPVNMIKL
jgi:NADH-quinone oxidoreductase subunit C